MAISYERRVNILIAREAAPHRRARVDWQSEAESAQDVRQPTHVPLENRRDRARWSARQWGTTPQRPVWSLATSEDCSTMSRSPRLPGTAVARHSWRVDAECDRSRAD